MKPSCFVLIPLGAKLGPVGSIDFDAVYLELLRPAIEAAGLQAVRADAELLGGGINGPMFDQLRLSDVAIVDLTTANEMVLYSLGERRAVKPQATVVVFAADQRVPFDVESVVSAAYKLDPDGRPIEALPFVDTLAALLAEAKMPAMQSPIDELLGDWPELS
ncbi:MAG: DUF4071 domain-containing protein, partial [Actinomycetota bacterium]|nr:DUF4071 domain-containing protein [Actinomycetota bacterium]